MQNLLIKCPACGRDMTRYGNRAETWYQCQCGQRVTEDRANQGNLIVVCPCCKGKLRLPANRGNIQVSCPKCRYQFIFYSGERQRSSGGGMASGMQDIGKRFTKAFTKTAGAQQAYSHPAPGPACRILTIVRSSHAYMEWDRIGIMNRISDNRRIRIMLDDQEQGELAKNGNMVLHMDSREHAIKCLGSTGSPLVAPSYRIPAGNEDYYAYCFNGKLMIAPVNDPFRESLTQSLLNIFRSQGMRDRMRDPNNRLGTVELGLLSDHIRLSRSLKETKGLKQWSLGGDEEKIAYSELGLTAPPENRLPSGYWTFLLDHVRHAIENDEQADMEHVAGGFRMRRTHKLY